MKFAAAMTKLTKKPGVRVANSDWPQGTYCYMDVDQRLVMCQHDDHFGRYVPHEKDITGIWVEVK